MSIIVGVIKDGKASIGADTQTNHGSLKISDQFKVNNSKIYKIKDTLIGISGWYAMELIFGHILQNKPQLFDFTSRQSIFESLLKMQKILEEEYFIETSENEDQPVSSNQLTAIIVNKNGLFDIDSYREVNQFSKFWAIGSGQEFALGAMHALYDRDFTTEEIARAGIMAAAEFNDGCGLPMHIESKKS